MSDRPYFGQPDNMPISRCLGLLTPFVPPHFLKGSPPPGCALFKHTTANPESTHLTTFLIGLSYSLSLKLALITQDLVPDN